MIPALDARAAQWGVTLMRTVTTPTSLIAFGTRGDEPVVLKLARQQRDEWTGGRVAAAFGGSGMVRVLEHADGAVLLEELRPGTSLAAMVASGDDANAMDVLADVVRRMAEASAPTLGCPTAEDWGAAFDAYLSSGDGQVPPDTVQHARDVYAELCRTQTDVRLLHGDLQHYNVLRDARRGWVAIDPKGVVAETEFEFGAALRNPHGQPALYTRAAINRRIGRIADTGLPIDADRVRAWAFAQAVMSAIWSVEDDGRVDRNGPALAVAAALRAAVE